MSRKLGNTEQTLAYFCCTFHVAYICDLDSLCGVLFDCLKTVIKKSQNLLLSDFRPRCLRLSLLSVIIIPGHLHGRWLSATELSHSLLFVSGTMSRHMSALYLRLIQSFEDLPVLAVPFLDFVVPVKWLIRLSLRLFTLIFDVTYLLVTAVVFALFSKYV